MTHYKQSLEKILYLKQKCTTGFQESQTNIFLWNMKKTVDINKHNG
jgi:hypothetical protein